MRTARAAIARRLESAGRPPLAVRLLSTAWNAVGARGIARPLAIPRGAHVIGVGGATLGGSYKTPFAIALAEALAWRGHAVALVGHAYRAHPSRPRVVIPGDEVAEVGDDALFAARRLAGTRASVVVGPNRQAAVDFAAQRAAVLVVDGLLQTRPARLARSILLVDGERGWGNGHCPPGGDLRASPPTLLAATDAVAVVFDVMGPPADEAAPHVGGGARELLPGAERTPLGREAPVGRFELSSALGRVTHADGTAALPLSDLAGSAVGLVLAVARPDRIVEALARRGVRPVASAFFPDHDRPLSAEVTRHVATTQRIDAWLTTGKCATKLPAAIAGAPVLTLEHAVRVPESLLVWADALFPTAGAVG